MARRDPLANSHDLIRRVYSYVAYRIGDGPDAEDVTSDVFERALRYRESYDPSRGEPLPWLLGIARRCVETARTSHHLQPGALRYESSLNGIRSDVTGEPEDLRTAVSNILDNAVKYSGNHVDVSVRLDSEDDNRRLVLRVKDRGVGIPQSELKSIFKRFYRVRGRALAHVRGTGLGLFLVRTIAKRHGGRVFAESAGEGQGATIIFELPRNAS